MDVLFTTVVRGAPVNEGGEIVRLDWNTKKVLARCAMPPRDMGIVDPNPRGNARGGKGVAVVGDEVFAASYHTVHVFDRSLRPVREISHNLFAGLHEIHYAGDNRLWVSSTAIDAAIAVDVSTGAMIDQYWPREIDSLQREFELSPLEIDKTADNRTRYLTFRNDSHIHLNAIDSWRGHVYALFNAFGAVVDLTAGRVIVRDKAVRRGHNVCIDQRGSVVVNDTRGHYVRIYDMETGQQTREISLMDYDWVRKVLAWHLRTQGARKVLSRFGLPRLARSEPLFVRGLQVVGDMLFVGASPAMILQIDRRDGRLVDAFNYSKNLDCCVHGLWVEAAAEGLAG